ncbi:serine hydrolase domain-containing protein [Kordiimonas sp.]|uniref:serine hydrolase domain-containing protein n=1 Tax=Kordiimonas sp. TaxID=1970157 RepID=UPI003A8D0B6D
MKKIVCLALGIAATAPAALAVDLPEGFDSAVKTAMEKWHAPGLGLAIVEDGEILLSRGYGIKSVLNNNQVDEHTLFQAGSTTKAFASMALAMLADDGKVKWDDPVIKHVPELDLNEDYVEKNLTIRDVLSHRSGVSQLSNINVFLSESLPEAWEMLPNNPQQTSFRQAWDYNNTIFALSGLVVEKVSGKPFHEFVKERILDPLGMTETLLLDADVKARKNRAEAHRYIDGQFYQIEYPYIEFSQSAGMINSTPSDMSKWLRFLANGGMVGDKRLVSEAAMSEMFAPQMLMDPSAIYPAAATLDHSYFSYGLAWFVYDYKGEKIVMHTGSIDGMSAINAIIPGKKAGVYAFINADHIEYRHALMYTVLDILLDNPAEDWSEKLYAVYHVDENQQQKACPAFSEAALADLPGNYTLPGLFPLTIAKVEDGFTATLGVNTSKVTVTRESCLKVHDTENPELPGSNYLQPVLNDAGALTTVKFSGLPFAKEAPAEY